MDADIIDVDSDNDSDVEVSDNNKRNATAALQSTNARRRSLSESQSDEFDVDVDEEEFVDDDDDDDDDDDVDSEDEESEVSEDETELELNSVNSVGPECREASDIELLTVAEIRAMQQQAHSETTSNFLGPVVHSISDATVEADAFLSEVLGQSQYNLLTPTPRIEEVFDVNDTPEGQTVVDAGTAVKRKRRESEDASEENVDDVDDSEDCVNLSSDNGESRSLGSNNEEDGNENQPGGKHRRKRRAMSFLASSSSSVLTFQPPLPVQSQLVASEFGLCSEKQKPGNNSDNLVQTVEINDDLSQCSNSSQVQQIDNEQPLVIDAPKPTANNESTLASSSSSHHPLTSEIMLPSGMLPSGPSSGPPPSDWIQQLESESFNAAVDVDDPDSEVQLLRSSSLCSSSSPDLPPASSSDELVPVSSSGELTSEQINMEHLELSRLTWGLPPLPILDQLIENDASRRIETLRNGNSETLEKYISPFSPERQPVKKRRRITISSAELQEEAVNRRIVKYLDRSSLLVTYRNTLEEDRLLAKRLGGWENFLQLKDQLAATDRDLLEKLLLDLCYLDPSIAQKITEKCIETTERGFIAPRRF